MRRRALNLLRAPARRLWRAALRAVVAGLVFAVCLAVALRLMGVPVPGPEELLDEFEGVSRLAEILS
ncbi:MAG TPA: hypothetical protein VN228_20830 [Pyrinomonadaceae bacterium]|nr:hypothetical protein [Pyrinomonadaceae bacterium]